MAMPVSVVVVSRGRPALLKRCLTGLSQLRYPSFEVVVVSDHDGLAAVDAVDPDGLIKRVAFDRPNISEARNLGCDQAAGEVIAFIDDDAVPEPTWLTHLTAPFERSDVAIAGGFVRGRNGISWQWKARQIDAFGHPHSLSVHSTKTTVFAAPKQGAIKTEGTNMAVRRDTLVALGGFDTAYHFFLDETDLNMRAAKAGLQTAIVPLAHVHHGYAASTRRGQDRVPLNLFDIGASWAVFLRKHVAKDRHAQLWEEICKSERARLLKAMQKGGLDAYLVSKILGGLRRGWAAGLERDLATDAVTAHSETSFQALQTAPGRHEFVAGWHWQKNALRAQAEESVQNGKPVTLLLLTPTVLYHRHEFHEDGYWIQTGGLWGRSVRSQPLVEGWRYRDRIAFERDRMAVVRGLH